MGGGGREKGQPPPVPTLRPSLPFKLSGHLGGACAASKQQAAGSRQHAGNWTRRAPGGPHSQRVPEMDKMSPRWPGDRFPHLSREGLCFSVGPPPAGSSDLVGFGPIWGLWHREKFRARAENIKTQFPSVGAFFLGGNTATQKISPRNFAFFYILYFGQPDPHRQEIAKYWGFGTFWPRMAAIGSERNSGWKTEKHKLPSPRGTFGEKHAAGRKFLPKISQLFYIFRFGRPDRHGREIAKYRGFGPFWPRTAFGT